MQLCDITLVYHAGSIPRNTKLKTVPCKELLYPQSCATITTIDFSTCHILSVHSRVRTSGLGNCLVVNTRADSCFLQQPLTTQILSLEALSMSLKVLLFCFLLQPSLKLPSKFYLLPEPLFEEVLRPALLPGEVVHLDRPQAL